jgi:hypothetical protein
MPKFDQVKLTTSSKEPVEVDEQEANIGLKSTNFNFDKSFLKDFFASSLRKLVAPIISVFER